MTLTVTPLPYVLFFSSSIRSRSDTLFLFRILESSSWVTLKQRVSIVSGHVQYVGADRNRNGRPRARKVQVVPTPSVNNEWRWVEGTRLIRLPRLGLRSLWHFISGGHTGPSLLPRRLLRLHRQCSRFPSRNIWIGYCPIFTSVPHGWTWRILKYGVKIIEHHLCFHFY